MQTEEEPRPEHVQNELRTPQPHGWRPAGPRETPDAPSRDGDRDVQCTPDRPNSQFGGVQAGFSSCSYHSPGSNCAPVKAAAATRARKTSREVSSPRRSRDVSCMLVTTVRRAPIKWLRAASRWERGDSQAWPAGCVRRRATFLRRRLRSSRNRTPRCGRTPRCDRGRALHPDA